MCGVGAPISYSMNADTADAVELQSERRVVGTLFATVNFAQKLGTGLASALTGGLLAWGHYQAGQGAAQSPEAVRAVVLLMSGVPALLSLGLAAVVGWGYTLNRRTLAQLGDDLARQRAAQAVP
jgi:Na+/melibiose symporter-like transporter